MRNLLAKEFLRRWRSPVASIGLLAFPFLMALMIGSVSGGGGGQPEFPRIEILLEDRDEDWLSELLLNVLSSDQLAEYVHIEPVGEEGLARMERGDASAMVILPDGFTDAVLKSTPMALELVRNPSESIKPEVVERGLELVCTWLDMAGKVAGEELLQLRDMIEGDEFPEIIAIVALSERIATRMGDMRRFVFPPVLQLDSLKEADASESGPTANVFGIVLAMVSVMSVLFAASRSVLDLFEEERTGMIRRMLSAPLSPGQILTSKLLFAVCFGIVVELLLLLAGLLLGWFDLSWQILGALVIAAALSFASAGLLSLVAAGVRTEKQAGLVTFILIMGMSAIGGSMAPVDAFPAGLQVAARMTLNYWAIEGLIDQLVRHESLLASWRSLVFLCAVGTVTMTLGWLLTRRRLVAVMA